MPEAFIPISQLLHDAVDEYRYTTPTGEAVWCPYIVNGGRRLPNPQVEVLSRPGAGKITPVEFQKAAQYAHEQVMFEGVGYNPDVTEAVRTRLVNGSLPDDSYNYTGVDCSAFVLHPLSRAFEQNRRNLFDELTIPNDGVVQGYQGGLSVNEFARIRGHNQPLRTVNVARLEANTVPVRGGNIQPGDLAFYTPTNPRTLRHVAVVLDTDDRNRVTFAHSGRRDPTVEIGGVQIFSLPRRSIAQRDFVFGPRGTMAIRRLNTLAV